MKNTKLLLLLPILALALNACKKDTDKPIAPGNYEVYSILKSHAAPAETFTIKADQANTITTARGTKLIFGTGGFSYQNGVNVGGENVNFSITEIYTKKQMLLNNAATVSNGNLIVSAGELNIVATANGAPVTYNWYYDIKIPTTSTIQSMPVFYGQNVPVDSSNSSYTFLNWYADSTSFTNDFGYFNGFSDRFGWINCDYFYNNPNPKDSLRAILPEGYDETNTVVFLTVDNQNVLANMMVETLGSNKFDFSNLPVGVSVHIITITASDGKIYYSSTPVVMALNKEVNITPTEINEADLDALLDAIP